MTSSRERGGVPAGPAIDALPPALSSMWRLCMLGYRYEPGLLLASFLLSLISALPDALTLGRLSRGVQGTAGSCIAAIALSVPFATTWFFAQSARVQRRFGTVTIVPRLTSRGQASVATIAPERPEH